MFCPNCGTQNPDAAQTCSKCSFHLKSAAAPKFKGTMLMMNQPGALPATPTPPPAPLGRPGVPPPPGAGPVPSKLKGTMVGVAPMAMGGAPFPPPAPAQPSPNVSPAGEAASAFSPPVPQAGVNPLGGTMAADAGVFGAFAVQQHAAGGGQGPDAGLGPTQGAYPGPAPPAPGTAGTGPMHSPYVAPPFGGAPPQPGFPPFGTPPPPGAVGAPPGYGNPPPNPYGGGDPYGQAQPPPGYGHPYGQQAPAPPMGQHALVPFGQPAGSMIGTLKSSGAGIAAPTRRNALLTMLLPFAVMFGGIVLSIVLAFVVSPALGSLASLFVLGGAIWYLLIAAQMVNELKSVTRSDELAWWPLIVPIYQMYFMWFVVPQEVAKAKQMLGVQQPPQHMVLYIFLWHFALASDLNDMVL